MRIHLNWKCLFVFVLLLTPLACGGSGGGGASAPAPTPTISASVSSLDFGGVVLNNSADQSVEITNTGDADLNIGQISSSNLPFSIASDGCSNKALTPSQKCSLSVRFAPTGQGSSTGTLSIPSNDPDSDVVNIGLGGMGYGLNVWINKVDSSTCPSLTVDVTVTDPTNPGTLLNALTKDNFTVFENGVQVQGLTATPIEYPSPVSVVLAIDFSESELDVIDTIKAAAKSFIDHLDVGDYAAIWKFNGAVESFPLPPDLFVSADATGKTDLKNYIDAQPSAVDYTLLFSALLDSIDRAALGTTEKRAVIVLSDGIGDHDNATLADVIADAVQKGIPVFTIYYVDPGYVHYTSDEIANGISNLQRLAGETGGQYYNGLNVNLTDVFGQIANILSNKYTLTYTSSCSGTISLDVQVDWNNLQGKESRTITF